MNDDSFRNGNNINYYTYIKLMITATTLIVSLVMILSIVRAYLRRDQMNSIGSELYQCVFVNSTNPVFAKFVQ